jgi:aspartyl-tRNA(Asn)/glutamyl-tRNA(Gln) amidotransferase subunit B
MSKVYETVIGLEVHVELASKTKIFCGCSTAFGGAPNSHTCPVCTGMPGSLPVLNKQVVEYAIAVGLATNCSITQYCKFDRKNYFYPDNPQNYQISQLYLPICRNGGVEIETAAGKKTVGIHEIHMEEDAGKLVHDEWEDCSIVDYNRSGVPLIEIVSEPDMRSAEEVIAYLEKLRLIIQYLGASDCKLNEGSMRADVNLSVREMGAPEFGTRTEMKNLNSFKAIARAIEGERARQIELIEEGKKVIQETRRWDDNKEYSYAMRSKEDAQDYRYFPFLCHFHATPCLHGLSAVFFIILPHKSIKENLFSTKLEGFLCNFDFLLQNCVSMYQEHFTVISCYTKKAPGKSQSFLLVARGGVEPSTPWV